MCTIGARVGGRLMKGFPVIAGISCLPLSDQPDLWKQREFTFDSWVEHLSQNDYNIHWFWTEKCLKDPTYAIFLLTHSSERVRERDALGLITERPTTDVFLYICIAWFWFLSLVNKKSKLTISVSRASSQEHQASPLPLIFWDPSRSVEIQPDKSRSYEICLMMSKCQPNCQNANQIVKM